MRTRIGIGVVTAAVVAVAVFGIVRFSPTSANQGSAEFASLFVNDVYLVDASREGTGGWVGWYLVPSLEEVQPPSDVNASPVGYVYPGTELVSAWSGALSSGVPCGIDIAEVTGSDLRTRVLAGSADRARLVEQGWLLLRIGAACNL